MKMKNFIRTAAMLIVCVILAVPFGASADENITVNGESVKVGDTVTFEYFLGGVDDALEAAGALIEYDARALEYVEGSLGFGIFERAIYNIDEGMIYYSAIDVLSGFDVKDEQLFVRAEFKVKDGAKGDQEITHTFTEIFTLENEDTDLTADDYQDRAVTAVNAAEPDKPLNPGYDAQVIDEMEQSSDTDLYEFMLGTDREELLSETAGANKGSSDTAFDMSDTVSLTVSWEEVASDGAVAADDKISSQTTASVSDLPASSGESEKDTSGAMVTIVVVVFVLLAAGAAVFAVLAKKKSK